MPDVLAANPNCSAEQFDREVVVIDIMRGTYFSLRGAAVELWNSFQNSQTAEGAISRFDPLGPSEREQLRATVNEMITHGLLMSTSEEAAVVTSTGEHLTFEAPSVEAFSDLAELIAIDPVHEVDAAEGWPVRPVGFPDTTA